MPQSLSTLYTHLVWSKKNREPFIVPAVEPQLYAYLTEICQQCECPSIQIGGWINHIHVLCMVSRKIAVMKLLEELKSNSSKWIKSLHPDCKHFYWQSGYAAFSVSSREVPVVKDYSRNQHFHHQTRSFQDECRGLLLEHGLSWDERFVWD